MQNYKNAVTPAEAGVQKPLTSLDSCFRRNDRKSKYDTFARGSRGGGIFAAGYMALGKGFLLL